MGWYRALLLWLLACLVPGSALAQSLPIPSLDDLISPALRREAVLALGTLTAHRPYQPATPLGTQLGLDTMLEVTLVKLSGGLLDELEAAGLGASLPLTTLPMAKLHTHKGINSRMDLGVSYIGFLKYAVYGVDAKWAFLVPDEGPTWALRLCYTQTELDYIRIKAWSPQLLVSRKLNFADAYMGVEYTTYTGRIQGSQTQDVPPIGPVTVSVDFKGIRAASYSTFLGLGLRIPGVGIKIALEGAYSFVKAHSLGLQLGTSW